MKKISVIIPIFNTTEFLDECITSVIMQTYDNLEILLIDDGSNEECRNLIDNFAKRDHRIRVFHLEENKGVGFCRNFGLDQSTGQYIYFLDSDDFIPVNTFEKLMSNIRDFPFVSGKIKKITSKPQSQEEKESILKIETIKKTKQFKNKTVLHKLISKDFIDRYKLRFNEEVKCYSDLEFLVKLMANISEAPRLTNCLYYKRVRNDPVSNPSLHQMDKVQMIGDFLKVYTKLRKEFSENQNISHYLDRQFLNFYRKTIVRFMANHKETSEKLFKILRKANFLVHPKKIKKMPFYIRYEMKALFNNDVNGFMRRINAHVLLSNLKRSYKSKRKLYLQLYRLIFMKIPLKEKTIVFESFLGKNYSDSPKYIYEYMLAHQMDYRYIWIFNKKNKHIPGNPKQIKRFSLAYYYYLATSKYWVSNSRMPKQLDKRKGNVYLQTWHGTPLKKLVFDMKEVYSANPNYKKDFYQQSRRWDYLVSANKYSSEIFRRAFKYDGEILEFGYPRNDILYSSNKENLSIQLKKKLNIPLDKKVILYAPTWRDDDYYGPGKYKFELKLDLNRLYEEIGDEYIVLLRMHYFIANNIDITGLEHFAYNLSHYDDIAELYLISDLLITDYSSVFFDYANLQRPILFYTYDLEKYRDTLRGFYIDMEKDVPGPLLKTTEEIVECIKNIDQVKEAYKEKYDRFVETFCAWDNGTASEQIVKHVFQ
jgi:CDP-glycerol glycerophosphotransferase